MCRAEWSRLEIHNINLFLFDGLYQAHDGYNTEDYQLGVWNTRW